MHLHKVLSQAINKSYRFKLFLFFLHKQGIPWMTYKSILTIFKGGRGGALPRAWNYWFFTTKGSLDWHTRVFDHFQGGTPPRAWNCWFFTNKGSLIVIFRLVSIFLGDPLKMTFFFFGFFFVAARGSSESKFERRSPFKIKGGGAIYKVCIFKRDFSFTNHQCSLIIPPLWDTFYNTFNIDYLSFIFFEAGPDFGFVFDADRDDDDDDGDDFSAGSGAACSVDAGSTLFLRIRRTWK